MLRLYLATAVALVVITGFTYWEGIYSDRFASSSVTAEQFGKLFDKVPMAVGPWVGTEMKAEKATLEMAGAVRHVSRRYVNSENNQTVDLWLIVPTMLAFGVIFLILGRLALASQRLRPVSGAEGSTVRATRDGAPEIASIPRS